MQRATLLSLGSINADFQVRTTEPPGSRELLHGSEFRRFSGGKAANTAWLAAYFGHRSQLLGRVGDDDLAEQALGPLRKAGVDLSAVGRVSCEATGVAMIMVPPDAKKYIVLASNANDCWGPAAIADMCAAINRAALPAGLVLNCEIPAEVARQALEVACARGMPVVLDPSFAERVDPQWFGRLLAITPNLSEAGSLVGFPIESLEQAAQAARRLRETGVRIVCLKLGDGGCVLDYGKGALHIPGGTLEPVDTTGAGDAFTGVLAVALLEGREPQEAAAWAVAAANIAVTGYGSQPAYPPRAHVLASATRLLSKARCLDG
nr:ribokinase [uncultured Pseudomonas sp.]